MGGLACLRRFMVLHSAAAAGCVWQGSCLSTKLRLHRGSTALRSASRVPLPPKTACTPPLLPPQWLIKRTGASFPRLDSYGRTALHWAAALGHTHLLRWLLPSGQYR